MRGPLLMITASITKMMIIRMIHSLTFCHHSFLFNLTAEELKSLALWLRISVVVCVCGNIQISSHKYTDQIFLHTLMSGSCDSFM